MFWYGNLRKKAYLEDQKDIEVNINIRGLEL